MRVAIFTRTGPCFPNVISMGLADVMNELGIENKIFYDSIPMLMRLLPLSKKQKRWKNNLQFRVRNKITNYFKDRRLIRELNQYDAIILSECYPNAFWKNYFALEELKKKFPGKLISYTDCPLDAAPQHKSRHLDSDDFKEEIYDYNLFLTDKVEIKSELNSRQAVVGVNIKRRGDLNPIKRSEFIAIVDFAQPGFETYREQQIATLKGLDIKTIVLEGKYSNAEIRRIYQQGCILFLSFPETFGLAIAECLAAGTLIFTPQSSWPLAWRLNDKEISNSQNYLPSCFRVYDNAKDLEAQLIQLKAEYDFERTPINTFNTFLKYYKLFYQGDREALLTILNQI